MNSRWMGVVAGLTVVIGVMAGVAFTVWGPDRREGSSSVASNVELLRSGGLLDRRDAAITLGGVRGPGATPAARALIEALGDTASEVRAAASRSIASIASHNPGLRSIDDMSRALEAMLRDDDEIVRASAGVSLRAIGRDAPGVFEAVVEGVRTDRPFLQDSAASAIASWPIRTSNDLTRLIALLDDPCAPLRRASRTSITRPGQSIPAEVALPVVASSLRSAPASVRGLLATMLGRSVTRVAAVRDTLMMILKDRDPDVRTLAAAALGAFSEDGLARVALRSATDDPDLRVRATASASLAVGRRSTRVETLAALREAFGFDLARASLINEFTTNPIQAGRRLLDATRDPSPRVRSAAALGLGELPTSMIEIGPVVEALTLGLLDRDPTVRRSCAAALARHAPAATPAAAALRQAVRDHDRGVSAQAIISLQALDPPSRTR